MKERGLAGFLWDKLTRRPLDKEHFNYREEMVSPGATFTILPDVWRQTSNNTKTFRDLHITLPPNKFLF